MKTLNVLLTLLLLMSTATIGVVHKNAQMLNRRIDIVSCKIDLVNARIDVLSGKPARHVPCLDTLFPKKHT